MKVKRIMKEIKCFFGFHEWRRAQKYQDGEITVECRNCLKEID
jgi:hypothetical protein